MAGENPSSTNRDVAFWALASLLAVLLLGIVGDLVRLIMVGGY
jgi:hypothetical protein